MCSFDCLLIDGFVFLGMKVYVTRYAIYTEWRQTISVPF